MHGSSQVPGPLTHPSLNGRLRPRGQVVVIGLLVLSAYLLFMGLGRTAFWDDEAEVAIVARNYLRTHTLTGFDGRNLLAYRNGTTLDADLLDRQPPLMFYVAAGAFRFLGVSELAGRVPFALLAAFSLLLFLRIVRRDFEGQPLVWLYSLAAFGLSTNFLLNGRQCRYYSLVLFFGLLTYDLYRACQQRLEVDPETHVPGGWRPPLLGLTLLGLGVAGLFFSHFLLAGAFLVALAVVHAVPRIARGKPHAMAAVAWRQVYWLLPVVVASAVCVPYSIRHRPWERPDLQVDPSPWWVVISEKLLDVLDYLFSINGANILPAVGLLGLWLAFRKKATGGDSPARPFLFRWLALAVLYVVFLGVIGPRGAASDRYLILSVPFACGCMGVWLAQLHQERSRFLSLTLLFVLIGSNVLAVPSALANYSLLLPRYLLEIHSPFPTASEAAAHAIRNVANKDDSVMTLPAFQSLPLMFYAGDKVHLCALLDAKTPLPVESLAAADSCLWIDRSAPRWIVMFGAQKSLSDQLRERGFSNPDEMATHYAIFRDLNVYFQDTQRAEPRAHTFGPRTDFDARHESVYLWRRQ